jgi:hypothetical protein
MLNNLESQVQSIVGGAMKSVAAQIAGAVRASLAHELSALIGSVSAAAPVRRGPGRPRKNAAPAAAPAPAHAAAPTAKKGRRKPAKVVRRTSAQVTKDDARILDYVRGHAGTRSVAMQKDLKRPKQNIASGLDRLRAAGKVKAKGQRSQTTYSA